MSRYFPTPAECGRHTVFGQVPIRTYAGDHMQLSLVDIPADSIIEWHQHVNEQMGMMVFGRARFHIGEEIKELGAGDMYFIPGDTRHMVVPVGGPAQALDVFYPIRAEYR